MKPSWTAGDHPSPPCMTRGTGLPCSPFEEGIKWTLTCNYEECGAVVFTRLQSLEECARVKSSLLRRRGHFPHWGNLLGLFFSPACKHSSGLAVDLSLAFVWAPRALFYGTTMEPKCVWDERKNTSIRVWVTPQWCCNKSCSTSNHRKVPLLTRRNKYHLLFIHHSKNLLWQPNRNCIKCCIIRDGNASRYLFMCSHLRT